MSKRKNQGKVKMRTAQDVVAWVQAHQTLKQLVDNGHGKGGHAKRAVAAAIWWLAVSLAAMYAESF